MAKMDESELLTIVQSEEEDSVGFYDSEIAAEQERALEYYYGLPFGDEVEGRSTIVSHTVAETVDWLMPDLLRVFMATNDVVAFEPVGAEDEQMADQATHYCKHVFWVDNPGFQIFHDWFKDGLLQKIGVVKVEWEDNESTTEETYTDQPLATALEFEADPDIEITAATQTEVPPSPVYPDGISYDLTIKRTKKLGKVGIQNIAPEEFLISRRAKSVKDARYKSYRSRTTLSELVEMGFPKAEVENLPPGTDEDLDTRQYVRFADEDYDIERSAHGYGQMREVILLEEYVKVDYDGDGIAELRRILRVGDHVFENDIVDDDPFATLCPVPMPHKFYGLAVADQVMDLQRTDSVLWRQMLDNMYLTNNSRTIVNTAGNNVNLDDVLTSRPGGVIRVKGEPTSLIQPMPVQNLSVQAFQMLEHIQGVKENRTGITKYNQGLDADTLNKTATGVSKIMDAANARKEMIARIYAETGVKDLFRKVLRLLVKHQERPRVIRMRGEWVEMDPRHWNAEMDVSINVGIGSGNKDQMLAHLMNIAQKQEQILMTAGPDNPVVTMENYYNTLIDMVTNAELKAPEKYFSDPKNYQPQQPQPDPMLVAMERQQQFEQMKFLAEMQHKTAQLELEREKLAQQGALKTTELAQKFDLETTKLGTDVVKTAAQMDAGLTGSRN